MREGAPVRVEEVEGVAGGVTVGVMVAGSDALPEGESKEAVGSAERVPSTAPAAAEVAVGSAEREASGATVSSGVRDTEGEREGASPRVRVALPPALRVGTSAVKDCVKLGASERAADGERAALAVLARGGEGVAEPLRAAVTVVGGEGVTRWVGGMVLEARAERDPTDAVLLGEALGDLLAEELLVPVTEGAGSRDSACVAEGVMEGTEGEGRAVHEPLGDAVSSRAEAEGEPETRAERVEVGDAEAHTDVDGVTEGESEKVLVGRSVFDAEKLPVEEPVRDEDADTEGEGESVRDMRGVRLGLGLGVWEGDARDEPEGRPELVEEPDSEGDIDDVRDLAEECDSRALGEEEPEIRAEGESLEAVRAAERVPSTKSAARLAGEVVPSGVWVPGQNVADCVKTTEGEAARVAVCAAEPVGAADTVAAAAEAVGASAVRVGAKSVPLTLPLKLATRADTVAVGSGVVVLFSVAVALSLMLAVAARETVPPAIDAEGDAVPLLVPRLVAV